MDRVIEKTVTSVDEGRKIGVYARRLGLSGTAIRRLRYTEGAILLNGSPVFSSERLKEGDRLTLILPEKGGGHVLPEDVALDIIYEDEDFLVINKPPFMPTHPSKGHPAGTLANAVTAYNLSKGFDCPFRGLNRLDALTSGVVVTARNLASAGATLKNKTYLGVVTGGMTPLSGSIEGGIRRVREDAALRGVFADGREAKTLYTTVERFKTASLLRFTLLTGRTHQIRVHTSSAGHPIIGDPLYGEESSFIPRLALHARSVVIEYALGERRFEAEAPLPDDIRTLLDKLRA